MKDQLEEVSMVVSQANIDTYAELTNDFNPLHVDPQFAATTPMGSTIAHGTLSLNLIWQTLARSFDGITLAQIDFDVRFLKPVFAGSAIVAGGQRSPDQPDRFEVWVKGADGTVLIAGHARLPNLADVAGSNN